MAGRGSSARGDSSWRVRHRMVRIRRRQCRGQHATAPILPQMLPFLSALGTQVLNTAHPPAGAGAAHREGPQRSRWTTGLL